MNVVGFVVILGGWIFSVCLHEFSHALVAYFGGDESVKDKGYLTFNPFRYAHPLYSLGWPLLFLLLGGIGLPGGAVYINKDRLRNRLWDFFSSLCGPVSNLLLLAGMLVPFRLALVDLSGNSPFWSAYAFLCLLQLTAAVFNLMPIPPLDGFGALSAFMPRKVRSTLYRMSSLFLFALVMVMLQVESVSQVFWQTIYQMTSDLGIPRDLIQRGYQMIRFDLRSRL